MKKLILCMIFLVLIPNATFAALDIEIEIKDSFTTGEKISFNYLIISDVDHEITYMPLVVCPAAPVSLLQEKTVMLKSGEKYSNVYRGMTIDESFKPQDCTAYVQITSPFQQIEEKRFRIETKPDFDFSIVICKDKMCRQKCKTILKNETIYLGYDSELSGLSIVAKLTNPDGAIKQIGFPIAITAGQIGTYKLEVNASKSGYKTMTKKLEFGVIAGPVDIPMKQQ
ncbi:MAG: hypothetical protein ABH952_07065 [Candidatus Omnitrophota bacterium]